MIFLTGGTGLLGLHILDELNARRIPVTALVRDPAAAGTVTAKGATVVHGRVEDPATWAGVKNCSVIIHSAALIAGGYSWNRFQEVNVEGTRLAARRARELAVPLVHISSVAVYGGIYRPGAVVDEAFPFAPLAERDFYARSKRMAEEAVWQEAAAGLRAVAIRPCVVYGEGDRLFLPKLVHTMMRGRLVPLIGGGTRPLSLVHARNVAQAVVLAAETSAGWDQAYNVTNDDTVTARDLVAAVGRATGRRLRTVSIPVTPALLAARVVDRVRRLLGPSRYPGSAASAVRYWRGGNHYTSEKARRALGWDPPIRHAEGLERAVRFILAGELSSPTGSA